MTSPTQPPAASAPAPTGGDAWITSPRAWMLLLLLGLLVYVPFLGMRDMWYPDEPDIAEVTKVMYESGDWVAPRRVGLIWVDYPPMIYWTGATVSHLLGGFSEFALRLPNALASIGLVLLIYFVGVRWYDRRTGFWAAFALMTFVEFSNEAISYRPDVNFSLAIAAAIFLYVQGTEGRARWGPRVAAFALFGVAMLAKGPLGLLLPGLVLTLWHGSRREWRRIFEMAPLSVIALAVYLPWFVACAHAMGADSILYELYAQNFARFVGVEREMMQATLDWLVSHVPEATNYTADIRIPAENPPGNLEPIAHAGDSLVDDGNTFVRLDGSQSFDIDGEIVSYFWTQISGPDVSIIGPDNDNPLVKAPLSSETLTFELTVTDDDGGTSTDTVEVTFTAAVVRSDSSSLGPLALFLLLFIICRRGVCRR